MITEKIVVSDTLRRPADEPFSILLIDDDEDQLLIFQTLLQCADADVVTARSAGEAREMLQTEAFDLVVCDVFMPKKSGDQFIRELREERRFHDTRIIAVSASSADLDYTLYQSGADLYCQKTDARRLLALTRREVSRQTIRRNIA